MRRASPFHFILFGNILGAISNFLWLGIFSRTLSTSGLKVFLLTIAIAAPLWALVNLDLRRISAADNSPRWRNSDYIVVRGVTGLLASVMMTCSFVLCGQSGWVMVMLVCCAKWFDGISECLAGLFYRDEKSIDIALSKVLRVLASLVVGIAIVQTGTSSDLLVMLGYLAAFAAPVLFFEIFRIGAWVEDPQVLKDKRGLVAHALPLGQEAFFVSLTSSAPVIYVAAFYSPEAALIFSSSAFIGTAVHLVFSSFVFARIKQFQADWTEGPGLFLHNLLATAGMVVLSIALVSVLSLSIGDLFLRLWLGLSATSHDDDVVLTLRVVTVMITVFSFLVSSLLYISGATLLQRNARFLRLLLTSLGLLYFHLVYDTDELVMLSSYLMALSLVEVVLLLLGFRSIVYRRQRDVIK